jgi:acetyl esterase/lipase
VNETADDVTPASRWQSRWEIQEPSEAPPLTGPGATGWTGLTLGIIALFGAAWIFLPPPTYFFLRFAVAAPELCAWLGLLALVGIVFALGSASRSRISQVAVLIGLVALGSAESVFFRLAATIHDLDAQAGVMIREPAAPLRAAPVSALDLFRGVPTNEARIDRGLTFVSRNGRALTLDVYRPQKPGRFPVIVQIHGGSWRSGAPEDHSDFAEWLTNAGYVVFSIDYRRAPETRWPAQLVDVDTALAWINAHSSEYEADTTRIVLLGRSAGGQLALLSAYSKQRPGVRGVISLYGPIDLVASYREPPHPDPLGIRSIEEDYIGGPPDKFGRAYADASPMSYATSDHAHSLPPTLLIYGARDNVVEAKYARLFAEKLNESGTSAAYLEIPWAEHGFDEVFSGVSSQLSLYYTERFLAWAMR